ncbi:MAG: MFS transporter [Chloroflexi bacterium]|nr:MFS transporter [Chloroflexota bacterium]
MPEVNQAHSPWFTRYRAFHSLEQPEWRKLWIVGHLWHLPFWMDYMVLGWVVLQRTDSPFLVALVGVFRLIPIGSLGFLAGVQADRLPKKQLLILAQSFNFVVAACLAITLHLGVLDLWHIYLAATLIGSAWAIDYPVRNALIRDIVPEGSIVNAMAINAASLMGAAMVGRWLAGALLDQAGPATAYGFIAISILLGLLLLPGVSTPVREDRKNTRQSISKDVIEGLKYAWRTPAIRGVMIVTVAANLLVFPAAQLHPVFARDVFGVGPLALGFMSGMDGLGSLMGAVVIAALGSLRYRGAVYITGTLIMGVGVLLFSLAPFYSLALPPLLLAGLGQSGFVVMQTAIPTTTSSPAMRGRAMGAIALAIGMLPLGMLYLGLMAEWIGAPRAVTYNCLAFLVIMLFAAAFQPGLRKVA